MSILIKGMEMPKSCYFCEMYEADLYWCSAAKRDIDSFDDYDNRSSFCPLIPVPPHGRLIDADAYEELIRGLGNREYRRENGTICDAIKFLHPHYAPTIIPADKEEV